jgi:hypothetical protein
MTRSSRATVGRPTGQRGTLTGTENATPRPAFRVPFPAAGRTTRCKTHRDGRDTVADHVYALTPAALTELAGTVMATSSFQDLLQTVADLAGRAVPGAATCGITVRSPPTVPDSSHRAHANLPPATLAAGVSRRTLAGRVRAGPVR